MSAHEIVARLDFCKPTGNGRWAARCPAHDDKSPSLGIRDMGDGRTLINCLAGCGAEAVLSAIGLDMGDLYPPTDKEYRSLGHMPKGEAVDSLVVEIFEHDRALGKRASKADVERYRAALKSQPSMSNVVVEIAYESGCIS